MPNWACGRRHPEAHRAKCKLLTNLQRVGVLIDQAEREENLVWGTQKLNFHVKGNDIHPLFNEDGFVEDWDRYESFVTQSLNKFDMNPEQNPAIFSEPNTHDKAHRMKMAEILFEKCNIPLVFLVKSAILTAYSQGKSTCLVLDAGENSTQAVSVHEGYVLLKSIVKEKFGGATMTNAIKSHLEKKGVSVRPHYSIKRG